MKSFWQILIFSHIYFKGLRYIRRLHKDVKHLAIGGQEEAKLKDNFVDLSIGAILMSEAQLCRGAASQSC